MTMQDSNAKLLQTLGSLSADIFLEDDPTQLSALWLRASSLLNSLGIDSSTISQLIATHDLNGLNDLIAQLQQKEAEKKRVIKSDLPSGIATSLSDSDLPPLAPPTTPPVYRQLPSPNDPKASLDKENLKRAMRAFRRRLKIKAEHEDGRGGAQLLAIQPPNQYPKTVWDELVRQGQLLSEGSNFYRLP